jgi:23S rRNA (adenine2503-C2)-methyltransferase
MKVTACSGQDGIASVFLAEMGEDRAIEFLESVQPPIPRDKKWVLIVSTLYGCPVKCPICDAGGFYKGKLSKEEILAQIDYLVDRRYRDRKVPADKFKIQFARMGEPAFNMAVLDVLEELPVRYDAPGLMPCISTIAPAKSGPFFEKLIDIKDRLYRGKFQLQFSIHTTDSDLRDKMIPSKKWDFGQIAEYGDRFFRDGDRKITLNFALVENAPISSDVLTEFFDPSKYLIKITPLNPTYNAAENKLTSHIDAYDESKQYDIVNKLRQSGYDVIVSIGEVAENDIGSNCGQYVMKHMKEKVVLGNGYSNELKKDF